MTDLKGRESELLLYTAPDGAVKVGVLFRDETAWLTQKALAELFGVGVPAINKHLKNIFKSGELEPTATISKMEMVRIEGGREVARTVELYNLDAIIAATSTWVGSRRLPTAIMPRRSCSTRSRTSRPLARCSTNHRRLARRGCLKLSLLASPRPIPAMHSPYARGHHPHRTTAPRRTAQRPRMRAPQSKRVGNSSVFVEVASSG